MAGTLNTIALAATIPDTRTYPIEPAQVFRLITPASSTAKIEISYDGGITWKVWEYGTAGVIAASTTQDGTVLRKCLIRATCVTGTATLEIDSLAAGEPHSRILMGTGTPASVVTAPAGTLYIRTDGGDNTVLYIKESGTDASGWAAVTAA